jgi:lipoate-protein ligase A
MTISFINDKAATAVQNMQRDSDLLAALGEKPCCVLHFYEWANPSVTYGYFTDVNKLLSSEAVDKYSLDLARRPTGGGIIFHEYDLAFSVILSASHPCFIENTKESYRNINAVVAGAISQTMGLNALSFLCKDEPCSRVNFCMAKPTVYDLIIGRQKVAGAAQRRTKFGVLHQGSICLQKPPTKFLKEILHSQDAVDAIENFSYPLLGNSQDKHLMSLTKRSLKLALLHSFQKWASLF